MWHILKNIFTELFYMIWEIYWGLALGFILSSLVRAFISTETISSRLGKNNVKAIALSTFFGAISSSCSYAAASMARTLKLKGSTWSNAVTFMAASTNLVFEIFIVIVTLLGWAFFGAEVAGGLLFIVISASLIAWFYPKRVREDGDKHLEHTGHASGGHEHHHHGAHNHQPDKTFGKKMAEASGHFYMDVMMVGKDILIGVVIASVLMALVPLTFWNTLFLTNNHGLPHFVVLLWNILMGVFIAIISFVCSVGNLVMATVFWHGGISFGGVVAYILADLVTIPMLAVYRRYYGMKTMLALLLFLTISIILASLLVDIGFDVMGWIPKHPKTGFMAMHDAITLNYKTVLNIIFIPASIIYFFWGRKQSKMSM
ncbi:permease [Mucilaginibacter sp.]|jgi:uncharacterized membrane protein YraQ (UPF0718 family)|uniref:permease n=1 Tax=Mucilaginibacter sp. TaxID=1882438 RepID=UPI002B70C8CE|nr:permease [Mucilaginibacter sp.]HTI58659.1 permease [Mucilaginibacter sp.]